MALAPEPRPLDHEVDRLLDDPELADQFRKMQQQHAEGNLPTIPYEDVRTELGLADEGTASPEP